MNRFYKMCLVAFMQVLLAGTVYAQEDVQAPVPKVGDSWTYQIVNLYSGSNDGVQKFTLLEVKDNTFVLERSNSKNRVRSVVFTNEWNMLQNDARKYRPLYPSFKFPLVVGKKWKESAVYPRQKGSGENNITLSAHVVGWESVTTKAGTWKALKIVYEGYYTSSGKIGPGTSSGTYQETNWYVPELKRPVKYRFEQSDGERVEHQLIAYKVD